MQALIAVGLVSILGQARPRVWVDGMYSRASPHRMSYFVNILVKENDHIIITARWGHSGHYKQGSHTVHRYCAAESLKAMAALTVANCLGDRGREEVEAREEVEGRNVLASLGLPVTLLEEVRLFL